MRCMKCGRRLKRTSPSGLGPVCERAVLGSRQKRQRAAPARDERQVELFSESQP